VEEFVRQVVALAGVGHRHALGLDVGVLPLVARVARGVRIVRQPRPDQPVVHVMERAAGGPGGQVRVGQLGHVLEVGVDPLQRRHLERGRHAARQRRPRAEQDVADRRGVGRLAVRVGVDRRQRRGVVPRGRRRPAGNAAVVAVGVVRGAAAARGAARAGGSARARTARARRTTGGRAARSGRAAGRRFAARTRGATGGDGAARPGRTAAGGAPGARRTAEAGGAARARAAGVAAGSALRGRAAGRRLAAGAGRCARAAVRAAEAGDQCKQAHPHDRSARHGDPPGQTTPAGC